MEKRKIFLDGTKSIACVGVYLHHFLLAFLPAVYFGIQTHTSYASLEAGASQAVWSVFINGNFMVAIFILITSYIFTKKFLEMPEEKLKKNITITIIKRYLRLSLPIFIVALAVLVVYKCGWIQTDEVGTITKSSWITSYYTSDLSFIEAVKTSFVGVPFFGNDVFSTAFWMIKYIMVGTFFAMLMGIVGTTNRKYTKVIYYIIAIIFLFSNTFYFAIVLGSILALQRDTKESNTYIQWIFVLVIGLFMGAYPTGVSPTNYYEFFSKIGLLGIDPIIFYHSIGAYFTVLAIFKIRWVQSILSKSIFVQLNKVSFAIYLLHIPIIFSFSIKVFLKIYYMCGLNYMLAVSICFLATTIVLLVSAYIFYYIIERPIYKFIETKLHKSLNKEEI